jgi:hypothetical protein
MLGEVAINDEKPPPPLSFDLGFSIKNLLKLGQSLLIVGPSRRRWGGKDIVFPSLDVLNPS